MGDLEKDVTPKSDNNMVEVNIQYNVPSNELDHWKNFVDNLLQGLNNKDNKQDK